MYNKEKFHNTLALDLGYEIVKDKRLNISVDDKSDDSPKVTISVVGTSMKIEYVASDDYVNLLTHIENNEHLKTMVIDKEIMNIIKSANAAYKSSLRNLVTF
jgi:hypothetical protein